MTKETSDINPTRRLKSPLIEALRTLNSKPMLLAIILFLLGTPVSGDDVNTTTAINKERVKRSGNWQESRFRYASATSLQTNFDGAALDLMFEGQGVAVRFGEHNVPAYGSPNLGTIVATVDGRHRQVIAPQSAPRESRFLQCG